MFLASILYSIMFIPSVFGNNTSTSNDHSLALSLLTKVTPKVQEEAIKTNVTIVSEGEPVGQSAPSISPKDQHAILMSLDKELSKDKISGPSDSRVKPRKGVEYHVDNETDSDTEYKNHLKQQLTNLNDIKVTNQSSSKIEGKNTTLTTPTLLNNTLTEQKVNTTVHKKPTVLSNEALDKIVFPSTDSKLSGMGSSAKTVTTNKITSPEGLNKRTQSFSGYSHPGMVIPVVITILVVPIFAVLGYMALQHGKEAWKNRHYKRMDFLLDGMYNE